MDAILVGRGTVFADDPLLTARPAGPRVAARVVVSASGELPEHCQLRATAREVPVIVYTANAERLAGWSADGVEVVAFSSLSLDAVLTDLGRRRFTNVLAEGGAGLLGSVLDANAADEFHVFIAPKLIGGTAAPSPVGGTGTATMADALALDRATFEPSGADVYAHGFARKT
jgi:diaminohydroxyphosphoribosylaminopyrimidine deaminase/5-amino-6-(5-phosphoribosylamino)uracil reductase